MPVRLQSSVRNRLLLLMEAADFDRFAPHLEPVSLGKGLTLIEPDEAIEHIYFPDSGVGSILAVSPEGRVIEAGLFGCEGMAPAAPLLGVASTATRTIIQVEGEGWRIATAPLMAGVEASAATRWLLLRYVQTQIEQTSYTALSNALHGVDQRLARWILMCDDRSAGRDMPLTHEFMAIMLGVRRPSVTTSLHVLEGEGFIRSQRGCVIMRDREAMERFAGDAYGKPEAVYRKLIGAMA